MQPYPRCDAYEVFVQILFTATQILTFHLFSSPNPSIPFPHWKPYSPHNFPAIPHQNLTLIPKNLSCPSATRSAPGYLNQILFVFTCPTSPSSFFFPYFTNKLITGSKWPFVSYLHKQTSKEAERA